MEFESDKGDDESEFEKKEVNEDENDNDIRETDNDNEWSDIDWGELNNTEQQESDLKDIDWNADISSEQQESVWNEIDWKEPEQENPDDDKATERKEEQEGPDHNETEEESDQNELEGDVEKFDPYERGDNYEQEGYSGEFENEYAQTMSTILITENEMYAYLKQYIEAMLTKEKEQTIQGEQNEINNLQAEPSELEQFLEQEKERIQLEQQQAELDKTVDKEPESVSVEEDVEQEQEIEPQADTLEEIAPNNEKEVKHQVTTEEINTET